MDEELTYHEQKEGWKHEWLADRHCVCIMRPSEIGGGFVTIDFERRIYSTGYGKPRQSATPTEYIGKGWKDRIVRDAIDHLERMVSATKPANSQST
jgi:hypothetical protein